VELAAAEQAEEAARLELLRQRLEAGLRRVCADVAINGAATGRLPNILNLSLAGADQEALLIGLDLEGVAASGASACQSGTIKPSHVLVAMGRYHDGDATVRLSLGRTTTTDEIDFAVEAFGRVVEQMRVEAL
jgi:cysteine desulfurase